MLSSLLAIAHCPVFSQNNNDPHQLDHSKNQYLHLLNHDLKLNVPRNNAEIMTLNSRIRFVTIYAKEVR